MNIFERIGLGIGESIFWYAPFTLPVFLVIWMIALAVCLMLSPLLGLDRWYRWSRNTTAFVTLLFIFSVLGNAFFVAICRGRIYEPGDPIVDFLPFVPGEWAIDFASGGHYVGGATHGELELIWICVALFVWAGTAASTRKTVALLDSQDLRAA